MYDIRLCCYMIIDIKDKLNQSIHLLDWLKPTIEEVNM